MNEPLTARIEKYLRQLSPHMVERMGNTLLREALRELKSSDYSLDKELEKMKKPPKPLCDDLPPSY